MSDQPPMVDHWTCHERGRPVEVVAAAALAASDTLREALIEAQDRLIRLLDAGRYVDRSQVELAWEDIDKRRAALAASSPPARTEYRGVTPDLLLSATRYAIGRVPTGMSQRIASQVIAFADVIRRDAGCTQAIVREVEDYVRTGGFWHPAVSDRREVDEAVNLWLRARDVLSEGGES